MKRHLFLTGQIGAGKSTAIAAALGSRLRRCGGFLTCRNRNEAGQPVSFSLMTPERGQQSVFLDLSQGEPIVYLDVFETLGIAALQGDVLVLDEIGGVELLCPAFVEALEESLRRDIPILGVLKGKGASEALANRLGLKGEYHRQADRLWEFLTGDENTMIYSCDQFDEKALTLASQWVREYCL